MPNRLKIKKGFQSPTCCSPPRSIGHLPTKPRHDLSCHAGQSPPTVPPDPDPRADRSSPVHEPIHPTGSPRHLLIRRRANNPSVGHGAVRGDCRPHYLSFCGEWYLLSVEVASACSGGGYSAVFLNQHTYTKTEEGTVLISWMIRLGWYSSLGGRE